MMINPGTNLRPRRIGRLLFAALALAVAGGAAALVVPYYGQRSASAEPAIPSGVSLASWFDNGKGEQHVLRLVGGDAPPTGVRASGTVVTDTDCDPDAQGLNHCRNRIDLGNGRSIEVIHNHAMHRYPCLAPGQRLSITRLNADWVVADLVQRARAD